MNRYLVTWGDESKIVEAPNESDAWAAFVDQCELAQRHPNLHARKVADAPQEEDSSKKAHKK